MSEKQCKWCKDEFCVNDQCPVCADYCPTVQYPGVCKYEELIEVEEEMTVGKCYIKALEDVGINVPFEKAVEAMSRFRELVDNLNKSVTEKETAAKTEKFVVGKQVHVGVIGASEEWQYAGEQNDNAVYVTRDNLLMVSFRRDSDWGTIMLNRPNING